MKTSLIRVDWIESSDARAPVGSFFPVAVYRYGSAVVLAILNVAMAAMQYLCRTRGPRAHPLAFTILAVLVVAVAGCVQGCGFASFHEVRPDGTIVDVAGGHLFSNPTVTGVRVATTQGTLQMDGLKSESQISVVDLLKAAAAIAPKP